MPANYVECWIGRKYRDFLMEMRKGVYTLMTEQDANYITLPLHKDRRCEIPTPAGQCTTLAEWQISDGAAWRPICYIHMSQLVREYREQREFDHLTLLEMDPQGKNTDDLNRRS